MGQTSALDHLHRNENRTNQQPYGYLLTGVRPGHRQKLATQPQEEFAVAAWKVSVHRCQTLGIPLHTLVKVSREIYVIMQFIKRLQLGFPETCDLRDSQRTCTPGEYQTCGSPLNIFKARNLTVLVNRARSSAVQDSMRNTLHWNRSRGGSNSGMRRLACEASVCTPAVTIQHHHHQTYKGIHISNNMPPSADGPTVSLKVNRCECCC